MPSNHLVFVYGGLRRGFETNQVMERWGAEHVSEAWYEPGHSRMVSLGAMPGLVPDAKGPAIAGDLYRVSWPTLQAIDKVECAPHFFRRVKVRVCTNSEGGPGGPVERAWLYVLANPGRFSNATTVECGDWKLYQSRVLNHMVGLFDLARKGEPLPKEYSEYDSASCSIIKPDEGRKSTALGTSSAAMSPQDSERFHSEWERRNKRVESIREANAASKENRIKVANRVYASRRALTDDSKIFSQVVVNFVNALKPGQHGVVQTLGGSVVTFARDATDFLKIIDWATYSDGQPAPGSITPFVIPGDAQKTEETPIQEFSSEAVSECVFCGEAIEYVPTVGWVGENLSPQCLVAPTVSNTQCHCAPLEEENPYSEGFVG